MTTAETLFHEYRIRIYTSASNWFKSGVVVVVFNPGGSFNVLWDDFIWNCTYPCFRPSNLTVEKLPFLFCVLNVCGVSECILFKKVFWGSILSAETYSLIKELAVICRNDCFFFFGCWIIALCIHCKNVHIDQWQSLADALAIIWNLSKFCIWYTQSESFVQGRLAYWPADCCEYNE